MPACSSSHATKSRKEKNLLTGHSSNPTEHHAVHATVSSPILDNSKRTLDEVSNRRQCPRTNRSLCKHSCSITINSNPNGSKLMSMAFVLKTKKTSVDLGLP